MTQGQDIKEKQPLQAIVLSETFDDSFEPVTCKLPKVLLPLVNTPLIDYTLHWLQRCGIEEVIIYCKANSQTDGIRSHCRTWATKYGTAEGMQVNIIASEDCSSLGDAMRDLYFKGILKSDFFLLSGDVISNVDLRALMDKHRRRRNQDRTAIMTCIFQENIVRKSFSHGSVVRLITASPSGKILQHSHPEKLRMKFPTQLMHTHPTVNIYPCVKDPNIAICSEVIPSLFSDNFDYRTRTNLIEGVIEHEELLNYSIYAEILQAGFAAHVLSLSAYEQISYEIIGRVSHPEVPEQSLSTYTFRYSFQPFTSVYWHSSAKFHKKSIAEKSVIDAGSQVDNSALVTHSVVGKHCSIGKDSTLKNSFIMDNVIIGDGCHLTRCFIGDGATLLNGVTLEEGVVLGSGVVVGPNITVPRATRLSADAQLDPISGEATATEPDPSVCGSQGTCYVYTLEHTESSTVWGLEDDVCPTVIDAHDTDNEEDSESGGEVDGMVSDEDEEREREFSKQVSDSVHNALKHNYSPENLILEINSSRHAYNIGVNEVLVAVMNALICAGYEEHQDSGDDLWSMLKESLTAFADVLKNYVKKPKDQVTVLQAMEAMCKNEDYFLGVFQKVLFLLNQDLEILDDEIITYWFSKAKENEDFEPISKAVGKFVEWLEQEEEDSG